MSSCYEQGHLLYSGSYSTLWTRHKLNVTCVVLYVILQDAIEKQNNLDFCKCCFKTFIFFHLLYFTQTYSITEGFETLMCKYRVQYYSEVRKELDYL